MSVCHIVAMGTAIRQCTTITTMIIIDMGITAITGIGIMATSTTGTGLVTVVTTRDLTPVRGPIRALVA